MDREDQLFDKKFQEILNGGEMEVPEGVWEGIADELDRIGRKRRRLSLFWKYAGGTIAAAAAVALFVVFSPFENGNDIVVGEQFDLIAENSVEDSATSVSGDEDDTDLAVVESVALGDAALIAQAYAATEEAAKESIEVSAKAAMESIEVSAEGAKEQIADSAKAAKSKEITKEEAPENSLKPKETKSDKKVDSDSEIRVSGEEFSRISEGEFEETNTELKKIRLALAMAGNTAVNTNRQIQSVKRRAPSVKITPTETSFSERKDNINYSLPVTLTAGVKIFFAKRWAVGTGVNYTLLSRKVFADYVEINEESGEVVREISSNMRNDQHYIGIPLNIYFSIIRNDYWDFYTYVGGAVDKCVLNKYRSLDNSEPFSYKRKTAGVQASANIGLGVEFCPTKHFGLFIDPCLSYYFDCNQPRSIRTNQPLCFNASAGVRFRL